MNREKEAFEKIKGKEIILPQDTVVTASYQFILGNLKLKKGTKIIPTIYEEDDEGFLSEVCFLVKEFEIIDTLLTDEYKFRFKFKIPAYNLLTIVLKLC